MTHVDCTSIYVFCGGVTDILTFIITGIPPIVAGSVVTDIILSLATFGISRVGIAVGLVVIVGVGTLTAVSFGVISLLLVQPEFNINIATVIIINKNRPSPPNFFVIPIKPPFFVDITDSN